MVSGIGCFIFDMYKQHTLKFDTGEMVIESSNPSSPEAAISFISDLTKQDSLQDPIPSAICETSTPKLVYNRKKSGFKRNRHQESPVCLLSSATANNVKESCTDANGCSSGKANDKFELDNISNFNAKDNCSSSKSNIQIASVKTNIDNTDECECSSSNSLGTEMQGEKPSEKEICISILRNHGLLERCRSRVSVDILDLNGSTNGSVACKICEHSGHRLSMLVCDSCEKAFHASCCIPRVKKIPLDDWYCRTCSRKKIKFSPEMIIKSVVSDTSNITPGVLKTDLKSMLSDCMTLTPIVGKSNVKTLGSEVSKETPEDSKNNVQTVMLEFRRRTPRCGDEVVKDIESKCKIGAPVVGNSNMKTLGSQVSKGTPEGREIDIQAVVFKSRRRAPGCRKEIVKNLENNCKIGTTTSKDTIAKAVVSECRRETPEVAETYMKTVVYERKKRKSEGGETNLKNVVPDLKKKTSEGRAVKSSTMIDSEPYKSDIRIGKRFQAEVPEWTGSVSEDFDCFGEPSIIDVKNGSNLYGGATKKSPTQNSIGNWLQCNDERQDELTGYIVEGVICGKWRRAPLAEVQTDNWSCFDSIRWDPTFADCAVPQELGIDQVLTHLKYVELLKPRITAAANKRKLNALKSEKENIRIVTPKHGNRS